MATLKNEAQQSTLSHNNTSLLSDYSEQETAICTSSTSTLRFLTYVAMCLQVLTLSFQNQTLLLHRDHSPNSFWQPARTTRQLINIYSIKYTRNIIHNKQAQKNQ